MENKDFELVNLPIEVQDETIDAKDFTLVDNENRDHEQKFQTKPTTFFKDSLKRFSKNKSSVVAAGILGTLLILSFLVPAIDKNDVKGVHPEMTYLEPKLFNAGTGFWDGTKKWNKIAVDVGEHPNATDEKEKQDYWWPAPDSFVKSAVSKKVFSDVVYTSDQNKLATGGYVLFGIGSSSKADYAELASLEYTDFDIDGGDIYLSRFDTYDLDKLKAVDSKAYFPENYVQGKAGLYFNYVVMEDSIAVTKTIKLLEDKEVFNYVNDEDKVNLTEIIKADEEVINKGYTKFKECYFSLRINNKFEGNNECVLIKSLKFESSNEIKDYLDEISFEEGNEFILRPKMIEGTTPNTKYWSCENGSKKLHLAKIIYCDFVYDSYEAVFGIREVEYGIISEKDLKRYQEQKLCRYSKDVVLDEAGELVLDFKFELLDDRCPVKEITGAILNQDGNTVSLKGKVEMFRKLGYDKMPRFIMGTDKSGKDMFKYVFEGLRTSLLLGIISFAVCFIIGLVWGSISGYFGGTVDLIMERLTDILHGLPWIVVMTLCIKHLGQTFFVFGLSICLTGWIGTAAVTRTQFYRFRGREYVLASRSLGASDARLIRKHILPNAMGTIITSSVLMIPSVIFSEATISYLGLGLKGMSSLGVILSDNQAQLTTYSYLLIFPAIIIALLMISFNLFGNGLRDAVNPSLKGEEQ